MSELEEEERKRKKRNHIGKKDVVVIKRSGARTLAIKASYLIDPLVVVDIRFSLYKSIELLLLLLLKCQRVNKFPDCPQHNFHVALLP